MTVKIDRAKYRPIVDGKGELLEAVFRIQEAQSKKTCDLKECVLGTQILPLQKYARVYYQDEDEVEMFHYACFQREFTDANRY